MKFSESLKKSIDFHYVYKNGKFYANRHLVMYVIDNEKNLNRLGISVSKKVGNSVVRHHLTRLLRESYRLNEEKFVCGKDIVVVVRQNTKDISYKEMESALMHLSKLQKIIKKD